MIEATGTKNAAYPPYPSPYPFIVNEKKRLRQITQSELAKRVGCASGFMSEMLRGDKRISDDMLVKLCSALEIKLSDLENWSPELAKIRHSQSTAKTLPSELAKAMKQLERLYSSNKRGFKSVSRNIDDWLGDGEEEQSAPLPELEKKAMAS